MTTEARLNNSHVIRPRGMEFKMLKFVEFLCILKYSEPRNLEYLLAIKQQEGKQL